jgi:diguanylate cyclase (GGDEF)-like protein
LLGDIGILVMHRVIGAEYDVIVTQAGGDADVLTRLSQAKFELDHCVVGGMLAEHWGLPPVLSVPIRYHHDAEAISRVDAQIRPLAEAVHVATICGEVFANAEPAKYIVRARAEMAERFKLSAEEVDAMLSEIGSSTKEAAKLFEVTLPDSRSYEDILADAQQAMMELTLQSQQQVQTIKKENEFLVQKASTDPLTGLGNRAKFNEFFEEQFSRAFKLQRPLAILMIDVDHFKKVNDTYGHQAGDEVLRRVGKLLKLAVRNIDLAARYGGEEFALVLTETESNAAAQMADEIRQALEAERILFEDKVIKVTASVGVAGTDRQRVFQTALQLANASDRAVYAAKAAGRNCVRLFRPKVQAPAGAGAGAQ